MRLRRYTDYALRVLLYLAERPDRLCSISEMASAYAISKNHLMKVVHGLGKTGYLASARGRLGGLRLARPAAEINLGAVVRLVEGDFELADCTTCVIAQRCGLQGALGEASRAFLAVLDGYSLADLLKAGPGLIGVARPAANGCAAAADHAAR